MEVSTQHNGAAITCRERLAPLIDISEPTVALFPHHILRLLERYGSKTAFLTDPV